MPPETLVEAVGASNTRLRCSNATPDAGVDTWRLGFKTARRPPADRFKLAGYEGRWYPNHSLVTLEGHPLPGQLCSGELLGDVFEQLRDVVEDVIGATDPTGVLRLDSTAQIGFDDPASGLAVLAGTAAVVGSLPGLKPEVIGKPAETVYLLSKRGRGAKLGRAYDPFFRGETARGEAVRLEAQDRRLGLEYGLSSSAPRERFHRRFAPIWKSSETVVVGGVPVIADRVARKIEAGDLTARQGSDLIGYSVLEGLGLTDRFERTTAWRRRKLLLEHGLAVADGGAFEPVEVDLGPVFEAALDSPGWG